MSRRQFLDYLKKSKLGVFADHDASSSNTKKNVVFDKIEFDDGTVEHLPRKREGRWFPITGHMIFTV